MLDKSTVALSDSKINRLGRIDRAVLKTPKSSIVLGLVGAVCSGFFACLMVNPVSLTAIPFYFYSAVVIAFFVSLVVWAYITHLPLKKAPHQNVMSKDERIDSFVISRKTFSFSTRIVSHEISNELMNLSHCAHLLKHRKTESFVRELADIKQCMDNIPRFLKMLSEQDPAPPELLAMLKVVLPGKYATVDVEAGITVKVPMLLLVSFVSNLYENAREAYERKFGNLEGFHVDVTIDGPALIFDDNAGGFDISEIALGKSSKGSGYGIFLATFLNDTGHLGVHPSIERTGRGSRVKIVFDVIEKNEVMP